MFQIQSFPLRESAVVQVHVLKFTYSVLCDLCIIQSVEKYNNYYKIPRQVTSNLFSTSLL